jgi:hypothetical protein
VEGIGFQENRLAITVQEKLPLMAKQIDADIAYLRAHGKSVILTYDGIDLRVYPRQCAAGGACAVSVTEANSRVERYLEYWKSVLDHRTDVCIFHQAPVLKFNGQYLIRHNGRLAFRDPHHLSFYGSELMARAFAQSPCYSAAR